MGIFSFFSRKVKISDSKLQEFIINWTGKAEESIPIFAKLLQEMDISMPVTLSDLKEEKKSFTCVSKDGKRSFITLQFAESGKPAKLIVERQDIYYYYIYDKDEKVYSYYIYNEEKEKLELRLQIFGRNLRDFIIDWVWVYKKEQSIDAFMLGLQGIGLYAPIILSNLNEREDSFECITDNRIVFLKLKFASEDNCGKIFVRKEEWYSKYNYNSTCDKFELETTIYEKSTVGAYSFRWNNISMNRNNRSQNEYEVTVEVAQVSNNELAFKEIIENCLFELEFPCVAEKIYNQIMAVYKDKRIAAEIKEIRVDIEVFVNDQYGRMTGEKWILSAILTITGEIYEYTIDEGDTVYSIKQNGDLSYTTPNVKYSYSAKTGRINLKIEADEKEVCDISNKEIIKHIKEKINSIKDQMN